MGGGDEYFMTTDSFYDARPQSELRKGNSKCCSHFHLFLSNKLADSQRHQISTLMSLDELFPSVWVTSLDGSLLSS